MDSNKQTDKNVDKKTSTSKYGIITGYQHKIALAAYYKAKNRGFTPGDELKDWLEAEQDIMGSP